MSIQQLVLTVFHVAQDALLELEIWSSTRHAGNSSVVRPKVANSREKTHIDCDGLGPNSDGSNLIAMASNLLAMVSNPLAIASNLIARAPTY